MEGEQGESVSGDCKLFCSGAYERGKNGEGTVLSKEFKDSLVSVSRTNDRVMSVNLGIYRRDSASEWSTLYVHTPPCGL